MTKLRSVRALLAIVAIVSLLTACGRSGDAGGEATRGTLAQGPVTGTVTMWAMGAEGAWLPEFVRGFEQENPGVKVEITAIPWDAAHNKLQTAIAAGNTPDMSMIGTTWMPDFADALATVPNGYDTSGFFPSAVANTKVRDRAAGVPWYVDTRVIYYRTDLAKQAGWNAPPANWGELMAMSKDMQTRAGAKWGIALPAGSYDSYQGALWLPWSNGASLTAGDKWTLNTPAMIEAFTYLQEFFAEGIADVNVDPASGAKEAAFIDGSTPIIVEGPALAGELVKIGGPGIKEKYATAVLPTKQSSTSFIGGSNLSVFNNAKNPDAAWRLAEWLNRPEQQQTWYARTGGLPSARTTWQRPELADDPKLAPFGKQLETAKAPPATTTWVQVSAAGDGALERIARKQQTPSEALNELQSKADAIGMG